MPVDGERGYCRWCQAPITYVQTTDAALSGFWTGSYPAPFLMCDKRPPERHGLPLSDRERLHERYVPPLDDGDAVSRWLATP